MNKIKELQHEIEQLRTDYAHDIDPEHHAERMRILKEKREQLKKL